MGVEAEYGSAEMLRAYLKADSGRWAKVVREKGLKAD
jgi:tripartite-type tricarboxylate transporter receptor subunit TctC